MGEYKVLISAFALLVTCCGFAWLGWREYITAQIAKRPSVVKAAQW
jgi:hypothetical protein